MIDESDPKGDVKQNETLIDLIATLKGLDEKIKAFKILFIYLFLKKSKVSFPIWEVLTRI
jgi:hypothetical protein